MSDFDFPDELITVTVTRSAGDDRAVVVHIDTSFEPDGSDGKPGLRILPDSVHGHASTTRTD